MTLIDIDGIAETLKLKRTYVRDKLIKNGNFPPPAISLSQRVKRWDQAAVMAWIEEQKRQMAR